MASGYTESGMCESSDWGDIQNMREIPLLPPWAFHIKDAQEM